ncbi:uncharacterized protein LOC126816261 isoform X2 [Patella vulgata]|uniref:uncharacterized protein LOC126816261 isoform X2 n=1 Tax=Patella vulgata TaxID=6465 RepID=UPI00217FD176|nr:uncharacterized protein LOC126816261 isoform X2 [Patella vulgata]
MLQEHVFLNVEIPPSHGTNETVMTNEYYDYYENAYASLCTETVDGKTEDAVNSFLQTYVFPILLLVGTIGNLISLRCLHQLSINVWSSCLYLNVLCVVDLFVLFVDCGNRWFVKVTEQNLSDQIMKTSAAICKVYPFVFQFILHIGPWILVASSVEMMIAARYPLLIYKMCTRERAKAVMLLMTVLLMCLNMHYFWTHGLVTYNEGPTHSQTQCIYIEEFSEYFRDTVWPFLSLAVGDVIPLIVVSALFFTTTAAMMRGRHKQNDLKKTLEKYFMDIHSLNELKTTFVLISLFYIIVITLRVILVTVEYLIQLRAVEIPCEVASKVYAVIGLLHTIIDILFYCYISFKIVIYLATSRRFRKELVNMVVSVISVCQRKDRINLSTNNLAAKPLMEVDHITPSNQTEAGPSNISTNV